FVPRATRGHLFQRLQRETSWTVSLPRDGDAQTPVAPLPMRCSLMISEPERAARLAHAVRARPLHPGPVGAMTRLKKHGSNQLVGPSRHARAFAPPQPMVALGPPVLRLSAGG